MNATVPTAITSATDVQVVTDDEQASALLRKMDGEFVELTGRSAYLYATDPSDGGAWRFVFTDVTAPNRTAALKHMTDLLTAARTMDFGALWWMCE